ncbi:MAG: DNA repair protein RecO [bacterium]|nr:DNA repair protein RecO [bacterium]
MYPITTTSGFIIESRPTGEAGKVLSIFTRDLGLVRASAQGIRFEKSKLRYHAQEYSLGEFSFVRGKEVWRMTNADQVESFTTLHTTAQELIARVALLLRRLLHGEEPHAELFEHIESLFIFLKSIPALSNEHSNILESLTMYRILAALGYIAPDKKIDSRILNEELGVFFLDEIGGQRMTLNAHINKALKESHL